MSQKKPPTMQQIAQLAGVSVTTVSHVLSGKRPVNKATAERILGIIRQADYVPASAARNLQSGRSLLIGLVVPDITLSYFSRIAKGVEEKASEYDYGVIFCSTSYSHHSRSTRYLGLLRNRTIDGLIYVANNVASEQEELRALAMEYPIVFADESLPGPGEHAEVTSDNYQGGRLIGEYLRGLGHSKAVVLAGPAEFVSIRNRTRGFKEFFPNALVLHGEFTQEAGAALVDDLLVNEVPFSCLMAGNDDMAVGAIRRLEQAGRRVPEDVSVVGFDDVDIALAVSPGLTTVRQPAAEIGARAAEILIEGLVGKRPIASGLTELPVELVVRGSAAAPAMP